MKWIYYLLRKSSPQKYKPVLLVTGCSSGIGLALAKLLWKTQYRVVITARESSLTKIKLKPREDKWIRPLDVNLSEDRKKLVNEIQKKWGGVDILVNNAGISYRAVVEHMNEVEELSQLRTNYLSPMAMIRLVLPGFRERGRGKIINVSSVSGMLAMPTMSSYSASKHALEGASEALWYEMKPLGINVSLIQPGFIRSDSFKNVYYSKQSAEAEGAKEPYSEYYDNMSPFIESFMSRSPITAEKVAKTILKVIRTENPPLRVPVGLEAYVFYYLRRLMPRRLFHPLLFSLLPGARHWGEGYSKARRLKK
ncbi:MAG: SDR family oxidoreductase [Bdellovibrionales bacterium]|nr:SDR family oxidoreductase [Bdellovibrionales bacterium]